MAILRKFSKLRGQEPNIFVLPPLSFDFFYVENPEFNLEQEEIIEQESIEQESTKQEAIEKTNARVDKRYSDYVKGLILNQQFLNKKIEGDSKNGN